MDDYLKDLSEMRGRYERAVAAVRADGDLTRKAKDERIRGLTADFVAANARATADFEGRLEREHRDLYRAAHAPEEAARDTQAALLSELRHQRVERDLTDTWDRRGDGPTVEEYEEALLRGDDAELAVYETRGPRRIKNPMRRQDVAERMEEGRRARMPPKRRLALEALERFEKERARVGYVLALRNGTVGRMTRGNMQRGRPVPGVASPAPGERGTA